MQRSLSILAHAAMEILMLPTTTMFLLFMTSYSEKHVKKTREDHPVN